MFMEDEDDKAFYCDELDYLKRVEVMHRCPCYERLCCRPKVTEKIRAQGIKFTDNYPETYLSIDLLILPFRVPASELDQLIMEA